MSLYKHYKLVVHSLEKYVRRSTRDTRLFGLYVIDALLRRSRAKFGEGPRDIFATRLAINMLLTFAKLIEVRSFDLPRVHKILQSWRAKNIFSPDLQDEMEAIFESAKDGANPDDDDDDEEDERKRQHMEGDASPVPPTGDESPVDFEHPPQVAHVAPAVPAPYTAAPRAAPPGGSRDPRRAAHAAAASSAQSFPPPPAAAPAASASDPTLAALANLQSMLATPAPAAAAPVPMPMAAAAPVAPAALPAAVLPVAPLPPPPAAVAEDDWGYDDEDEEEEDEEARKEKLRVRLEQEKARMEAAQIDLPAAVTPAAQTPTSLTTPQDPFGHMQFPPLAAAPPVQAPTQPPAASDTGAPAAAPARRSRFGAPKSKEEVEASLAAAAPALLHSSSAASGGSYERRGPTSPPAERRRSRSRSRERDQQRSSYQQSGGGGGASSSISISGPNHGGGGAGGGGGNGRLPRDAQSPGFVRLPDSEQVGTSWVRVLSTTLRVGHAPLSSLGLDPAELRTTLKERFSVFGQVDWLNPTEKQSYVRFRTRRDACMAKSQAHPMQIGGAPARLHWAKAREMDQEMFNQLSGEGAVEAGSAVLQRTPVEAPDLDVDEDFRDKRRGRVGGAGGAGGASEGRGGAAQSSGPESYPVTGWSQPAAAAVPNASPFGTAAQQTQTYPHAMAFLAQQPMQQQQQQQQAYAEQAPAAASGPYVHPSRPWMQQ